MITWVVQTNRLGEAGCDAIAELVADRLFAVEAAFDVVEPEPPTDRPCMVYGSVSLAKAAAGLGVGPYLWPMTDITHRDWYTHWGDLLLNHNAQVMRLNEIPEFEWDQKFVRPTCDLKPFPGQVVAGQRVSSWRDHVINYYGATPDQECVVADVRPIVAEWRCFVVDGEPVTSSQYRRDGTIAEGPTPDYVLGWVADEVLRQWQPAQAFVLDVCLTQQGLRVVEVNSINCSGLYGAGAAELVEAIDALAGD